MLKNAIYLPGEAVFMSDIGPEPANHSNFGSTLVCITTSVNPTCCNNGSVVGDWFYPNHTIVPHGNERNVVDFATYHYTNQIRLARADDSAPPLGVYTCNVDNSYNASITIQIGKFTEKIQTP